MDYSQWNLTNDRSITGVGGLTLLSRLGGRIKPETVKDCRSSMLDNRCEKYTTDC